MLEHNEEWTFAGFEYDGESLYYRYLRPDKKFCYFKSAPKTRASHQKIIGGIYEVTVVTDDAGKQSFKMAGAKFLRRSEDAELIESFQATDATANAAAKAHKMVSTSKDDHLEALMLPLRRAYSKLPYPHRAAFELWVLARLRRGGV